MFRELAYFAISILINNVCNRNPHATRIVASPALPPPQQVDPPPLLCSIYVYIHNVFYIYRENKRDKKVVHGIEGEGEREREREREREFVGMDGHQRVRGSGRAPEGSWVRTGTGGFVGADGHRRVRGNMQGLQGGKGKGRGRKFRRQALAV